MTKSNRRKREALLAAPHEEMMRLVGIEQVTPVGGNIFLDLGFSPEEAALLKAKADAEIDAELALKARSESAKLLDVVSLPDGRRGSLVEFLDAEHTLVEIVGTDGATQDQVAVEIGGLEIVAKAPSSAKPHWRADSASAICGGSGEAVLPVFAKRKLGDVSVEEILEIARQAWPRAREIRAGTRIETSPADDYIYDEAEDTFTFVVGTKPIVKLVSNGRNMNVGYSVDGEVVKVIFLNASTSWKS